MTPIDITPAIDRALEQAMRADDRIVVIGEDVPALRQTLLAQFGRERVIEAPISESAFLGAGVGAALAGLRPVVEIMFIDFIGVALNQLANEAAMIEPFSDGRWNVPLVIRAACGGGLGDAGQHEQVLWGLLAGIPGVAVVAPSNPADAAGLMLSLLQRNGPSVLLEHKLMSAIWRDEVGGAHREGIDLDIPIGDWFEVDVAEPVPLGQAVAVREGDDAVILTAAHGVHMSVEAADQLSSRGVNVGVVDLRSISPLDRETVIAVASAARSVVVVDEDYGPFGLSGELAALLAESGVHRPFARVTTTGVIPFAPRLEREVRPSVERIMEAVSGLTA